MSKTIHREIIGAITADEGTLAKSIGSTKPHSLTFEVSEFILADPERWMHGDADGWSEPVQFRFDRNDDGSFDMAMRRLPEPQK